MPTLDELAKYAYENREKLIGQQAEIDRLRARTHELTEAVGVIRYLADQVKSQGEAIKDLTTEVAAAARVQAVQTAESVKRPTAAVIAQYASVIVAIVALVVAATR